MVQSELHERLEYLVNYSSQLIFVSGDSVAQQKKTLESFVFQQHDDTEIAYLSAKPDMDLSDYRRELCKQLLGTLVGSYVRPLNELLAGLNEHVGPILITITQAEHVPDALLQELWDLVLQSRFAGNKQHLNVLLFGETQWAEKAKKWLPAKNTETPLLISSQSVAAQQPGSELDIMIENRRKAFHEHLANRDGYEGHIETKSASTLGSPLFISLIAILFLCVFGGLVYWQYSDDINALFTPIEQPTPTQTSVQPGSAFDELQTDMTKPDAPATDTSTNDSVVTSWDDAVAAIDNEPNSTDPVVQPQPTDENSEDLLAFIEDVTSEPTPDNTEEVEPVNNSTFADSVVDSVSAKDTYNVSKDPLSASGFSNMTVKKASPQPSTPPQPEVQEENVAQTPVMEEAEPEVVEDVVAQVPVEEEIEPQVLETEPLNTTPEEEPPLNIAQTPQVDGSSSQAINGVETSSGPDITEPAMPELSEEEMVPAEPSMAFSGSNDYDNQQLSEMIEAKDYVIQLAGLKDEALMAEFITDNNLAPYIWIYRTQRYGGDWFVLIYNQRFETFSAASSEVSSLPPFQGREGVFIKRGKNILDELQVVAN